MGILQTNNVTSSSWPDSSVSSVLHWYRRGHVFKSCSGLNFFQALISQLLKKGPKTAMINYVFTSIIMAQISHINHINASVSNAKYWLKDKWMGEKWTSNIGVYLGVKTCKGFLCFVAIVRVKVYYVGFFVFFVYHTGECYRLLHWGWYKYWK